MDFMGVELAFMMLSMLVSVVEASFGVVSEPSSFRRDCVS
jgi:hypothetical protein